MKKILIICKANSCRSQIAEAILKKLDPKLDVRSAGTEPAEQVHPFTIKVMKEIGMDISNYKTKNVNQFIDQDWDYVITVCDIARQNCPVFRGNVKKTLFIKFADPLAYAGDEEFILKLVRSTREKIIEEFEAFYNNLLIKK